ncbi:MAG: nicotinate (nicotinamide) nucleotide adenylyltransferase [Candidatus Eisenbacteria bacterium]|nr:nicotinate (nicotinamide) nucleotide adenylyltransferase [Candidatus Eisenbacteria bacterium]
MPSAASGPDAARRLGVLGGTFDPPHIGHLILADQCRRALGLERVLVVPAGHPPHKPTAGLTSFSRRVEMARLAFPEDEGFGIETLEGERDGPSYTVETLQELRRAGGAGIRLWLLMGSDSLEELETWKAPERIVALCRLAVYGRPGSETAHRQSPWTTQVDPVTGPLVELSSTQLREMARAGRSLRYLVPAAVASYIRRNNLYGAPRSGAQSPQGDRR